MDSDLKILVVDDEPDFASGLARLITSEFPSLKIHTAGDGKEALSQLAVCPFHIVLTDLQMPKMDGMTLTSLILQKYPGMKVIILTGFGTIEKAIESVRLGAFDFLTKPVSSDQLYRTLSKAIKYIQLQAENDKLRKLLSQNKANTMLGESNAIKKVQQEIKAVAISDYPVLISGDSGTGKELASRMIHQMSSREKAPFLSINCPAIPDTLLESELFGYKKGAFTGAEKDKEGLLLTAHNGTLHLDEIGDVSQVMQTKLLRFLQEGEVRPVGSTQNFKANVRVIASTNQSLEDKIADNTFRADLFYRLNVVNIRMPSLKERVEDIPMLSRFFFEQTFVEMGILNTSVEPEVLSFLSTKEWPGNVRELQNYVRRMVVFSSDEKITMKVIHQIENPDQSTIETMENLGPYKTMKTVVTDRFTHNYFSQLLKQTNGNISETARISGLSRVAIQKLCARLGIDASQYR